MIVIFSFQRVYRLQSLIKELPERPIVIDDGSEYPTKEIHGCSQYLRFAHQGREGFYRLWDYALKLCRDSKDDWFLFLQDDVDSVQFEEIQRITANLDLYAFNIMNRGPDRGWTNAPKKNVTIEGVECQTCPYVDCIFATNRKTLELLEWKMNPVYPVWLSNPNVSSGVGMQLSQRLHKLGVTMYKPVSSLAHHGNHESLMHPTERRKNPLVSI
jgi:hypothetical protein